jgi:hypothetical protein
MSGRKSIFFSSSRTHLQGEALGVIGVIPARGAVELLAREVLPVLDQVDRDLSEGGLAQEPLFLDAVDQDRGALAPFPDRHPPPFHHGVERHHDPYVMPQVLEGLGERAGYICQSAGLGEWGNLGRYKQNLHVKTSKSLKLWSILD